MINFHTEQRAPLECKCKNPESTGVVSSIAITSQDIERMQNNREKLEHVGGPDKNFRSKVSATQPYDVSNRSTVRTTTSEAGTSRPHRPTPTVTSGELERQQQLGLNEHSVKLAPWISGLLPIFLENN